MTVEEDAALQTALCVCGAPLSASRQRGRPRKWCSERCRKQQYSVPCVDCGAPVNGSDGRGAHQRCNPCSGKRMGAVMVDVWMAYRLHIEQLWREGKTAREIGEIVGWTSKPGMEISTLRARGYDLPHRVSPEHLARIKAGSDERLRKARAVYNCQKGAGY